MWGLGELLENPGINSVATAAQSGNVVAVLKLALLWGVGAGLEMGIVVLVWAKTTFHWISHNVLLKSLCQDDSMRVIQTSLSI